MRVITARAVGFVLAGVALFDGAGLLYGGDSAVQSPSWAVFRAFPGPETVGLIYLTTAVILIYALARPGELLAWVLSGGMVWYLVVAASFVASWLVTGGQVVWPALSKPLSLTVLWLLVLLAKPITPAEAPPHGQE
ncbi:hypothetical protein [Blastococcus sp. CCUG 61487]|uniref:hypothetical protein n=1 Tax=Blastococcus sp. CCUG 61487 TaxID=1840703 RepID=UPI0010C0557C|nr:hypothetical protein [Blastococcus sp. CCUG 61487]